MRAEVGVALERASIAERNNAELLAKLAAAQTLRHPHRHGRN